MANLYYVRIKHLGFNFEEVPIWHKDEVKKLILADEEMKDFFKE